MAVTCNSGGCTLTHAVGHGLCDECGRRTCVCEEEEARTAGMDDPVEVPEALDLRLFSRKWEYDVEFCKLCEREPKGLWFTHEPQACHRFFKSWRAAKAFLDTLAKSYHKPAVFKDETIRYIRRIK